MDDMIQTLSGPVAYPMENLSSEDAALLNGIFTANRLNLDVPGLGELIIEILPRLPGYSPESGIGLKINIGPGRTCLGMEDFIFKEVTDRFFRGHGIPDLPAEIRPVLLEAVFEHPLSGIESGIGDKCAILEADFGRIPVDPLCRHRLFFRLVRPHNSLETRGHLDLDPSCLRFLAEFIRKSGTRVHAPGGWDFLEASIVFEMGWTRLTAGKAARIRLLDIVLLAPCFSGADDRIRARLPDGRIWNARMDMETGRVRLTEKGEKTMTDAVCQESTDAGNGQPDAADRDIGPGADKPETAGPENTPEDARAADKDSGAPALDTDAIPVSLVFELGRQRMPLGELKKIGPGFLFQLAREAEAPVIIRAGDEAIGAGDVVRIGDRIGVRVLKVFHHADR